MLSRKLQNKSKRYWNIVLGERLRKVNELVNLRKFAHEKSEIKKIVFSHEKKEMKSQNLLIEAKLTERQNNRILKKISNEKGEFKKRYLVTVLKKVKEAREEVKSIFRKSISKIREVKRGSKYRDRKGSGKEKKIIEVVDCDVLVFSEKVNFHGETVSEIDEACNLRVQGGELANFDPIPERASEEGVDFGRDLDGTCGVVLDLLEEILGDGFVEEYEGARQTVKDIVDRWPSVIVDAFPGDHLVQQVLVAEAVERGAALVSAQHGGWYGEVGYFGLEWMEKQISDVFATWGYETDDKDVRLPAAKLMNDRRTKRDGDSLLWLSRSVDHWGDYLYPTTFFDLIDGVDAPHEGSDRYERAKVFYDALSQETKNDILLRFDHKHLPDVKGYMRQLKHRIDRRLGEATIDRGGAGLEGRIRDARLILVDHVPSTVFAECIHSGVPTILFDQVDDKWLTDNARQAYRALEDAGVLYQDPEAAARKVDEVYADPVDWWTSSEVETAVNEYKNEFAYVGEQPAEEWATFFEELYPLHTR